MLILNGLRQIGPVSSTRLLEAFNGDPIEVLSSSQKKLLRVKGMGDKSVDALLSWRKRFDLEREVDLMERSGIQFVNRLDDRYPKALKEIYDPPVGLYWKGNFFVDRPCVAVVGTRRATLYGRSIAKKLSFRLAQLGFCIVSGMARGTDTAAHEGALDAGGETIAVFGCGMDIIYPPENLELYRLICENGAVVSEFPFGRRADRQTFPMRNRVVSGMCEAVIVIESAVSGGSMITAKFAGEQGRQVMAVPGRIDQESSAGCHQLLREGATLVTSVEDVLEELNYSFEGEQVEMSLAQDRREETPLDLNDNELQILSALVGGEALGIDRLAAIAGLSTATIAAQLVGLELKGLVVRRLDGLYEGKTS